MLGWIVPILFLIVSIVLLSGRGAWLIAGYNTLSKDEKKKINEKRLCRELGVLLFVVAIIKLIRQMVSFDFPDALLCIVAIVIFFIYGAVRKKLF